MVPLAKRVPKINSTTDPSAHIARLLWPAVFASSSLIIASLQLGLYHKHLGRNHATRGLRARDVARNSELSDNYAFQRAIATTPSPARIARGACIQAATAIIRKPPTLSNCIAGVMWR